jgi:DNA invertase Pin-like site-specific DNA recombinase
MRAVIVRRVSTEKEVQENSLQNQKDYFQDYCLAKGWDVVDIYTESESGTKFNRKEMNRLIADAKAKKFDIILTKELSRLARNQRLALEIKEIIQKYDIHLVTLDGAIDTTTGNTQMFGLFAWIYEQEAQRTSERIKMAFQIKAKKGQFKGSIPPYGYRVSEGTLFLKDDGTVETVQHIFQRYMEGKGFDAIARELYEDGVPTPSMVAGKKKQSELWNGSSVRNILENPHYTGDLVQGRQTTASVTSYERKEKEKSEYIVVKGKHEAIVSHELFDNVQQLIESNRRQAVDNPEVKSRPHQNVNLFTGVIFCEDCNSGFHYQKNCKGYICGRSHKHGDKACEKHRVREKELVAIIQEDLQKLARLFNDQACYNEVKSKLVKSKARLERELKSVTAKIEDTKRLKSKALSKYLDDVISKSDYDDYVAQQDEGLTKLVQEQERLYATLVEVMDSRKLDEVKSAVAQALSFSEINREIINRFIEKIVVTKSIQVKLYYRFAGTSKILSELLG